MNTWLIKIFFTLVSLGIFLHVYSYSNYEITEKRNILGTLFIVAFTIITLSYSNYMFWTN